MKSGLDCHYPAATSRTTAVPRSQRGDDAHIVIEENNTVGPAAASIDTFGDALQDANADTNLSGFEGLQFDWDNLDIDLGDNFLIPQADSVAVFQTPRQKSPYLGSISVPLADSIPLLQQLIPPLAIPRSPTEAHRSLVRKTNTRPGASRAANMLLHMMKSYSIMILQQNNLPPFIHPQQFSINQDEDMEPLYNCISLMHMIGRNLPGSRALFWRNVRMECERLHDTHHKMNRWKALASLQALLIYTVMRVDEGETDYNNLDSLLQRTIIVVANTFNMGNQNAYSSPAESAPSTVWKDWIFEESSRRLCTVFQVINMLVWFEPAGMCDMAFDLLLAPLPSKKQLWEAESEFAWKADGLLETEQRFAFGLAVDGELVKIDKGGARCEHHIMMTPDPVDNVASKTPANWEDWCSEMDNLGNLVMLAASLIG
ncbi:hypothetical protein PFICI_03570 [Pestalotiopsis fici W106-1]|uniref:Transcription factor domain-containing protein n=1 Tax=Pestalotiopsis fici (strain W106-1 / CGMCC3.15140) TaxID=1229662 RepID=W3XHP0_PESFW|nr:uncharacterized protein PFICI_03570 [Pestalotiopsis fici W106-1]ETS85545.1 hypothetical protein PFICI_03570 [Pestalotiopsis fici W106-1]